MDHLIPAASPRPVYLMVAVDSSQGADGHSPDERRREATVDHVGRRMVAWRERLAGEPAFAVVSDLVSDGAVGGRTIVDAIELRGVSRTFDIRDTRLTVLQGMDLTVAEREIVSIVGPNGCGKSTLLRIMAGLLLPESGSVLHFGATVDGVDPRVGLVFQEPRLLPWRDVLANVAFPLELSGVGRETREARAREVLALTGLQGFTDAYPNQLSGGMAQRAALARALAPAPDVLLLDEPFSALDAMTRERLDDELLSLWGQTGTTIVLVTHSISEAVHLSDRVLVMSQRPGHILADVSVTATRPRRRTGADAALLGIATDEVRRVLADAGSAVGEVAA